jgi:isopentenyl phosphate kinase
MIVLKIGGSVITKKDRPMTVDEENIMRISEEIRDSRVHPIILVHGGGSFGHPIAKKHGLPDQTAPKQYSTGFSETHNAMVMLNNIIIDSLTSKGIPCLSVTPSSFIITKNGRIKNTNFEIIRRLFDYNLTPVLYGDVVIDSLKGLSVLSGDQIAAKLAIEMKADRLIFGVDVDGVYTLDPKLLEGDLIETLSIKMLEDELKIGEATTTDVTGGMLGKLKEAKKAAELGIMVHIINASKKNVLYKALKGEPVRGTILKK